MDLSDALGEWPGGNQSGGQNNNPSWPGQPSNPTWPGGQPANPMWPGAPTQPSGPGGWPSAPSQPSGPGGWPSGPSQPSGPGGWPSAPSQPSQPSGPGWPSGPSGPSQPSNPSWPSGPAPGPAPSPSFPVAPQTNLSLPFKQDFPSGLHEKMLITIAGTVNPHPNKFIIDFYAGSDLVFHFNPRFNEGGKQVIVRNSEIGKRWGKEERELPHFPFRPGQGFEIKILVTKPSFKVAVNNSHLLEFKHRASNLRSINRMNIFHDITLSKVNVENVP